MKPRSREINVFSMSALDLFASALGAFILLTVVIFPYFPNEGMVDRADLEEVLNELGDAVAGNAELQRIHDELNGAIGSLQRELAACRGELAACREETRSQQAQAEEQQRQIEEQQRQIEEQQAQAGEQQRQQRQIEEQQRQIEEQQAQAGEQQRQIEEQQRQIEEQQAQAGEQQRQIEEQQRQIGEQEDRIADLERRKFMLVTISWNGRRGDDVDLHVVDPNGREYYFSQRSYPGSDARFEEDSLHGPGNELWLQPQLTPGEYRIYYNPYSLASDSVEVRGRIVHPAAGHELRSRRLIAGGPRQPVAVVVVDDQSNITVRES